MSNKKVCDMNCGICDHCLVLPEWCTRCDICNQNILIEPQCLMEGIEEQRRLWKK
jgi:hypothetical protein